MVLSLNWDTTLLKEYESYTSKLKTKVFYAKVQLLGKPLLIRYVKASSAV
jgi:hypothetical protein